MRIEPILFFSDNYCYAIYTDNNPMLILVDPAQWSTIRSHISNNSKLRTLQITHVFTTHHHSDHSGGNNEISRQFRDAQILGGEHDRIPACNFPVRDNQQIQLENGLMVTVYHSPCHTRGHVLYYVEDVNAQGGDDIQRAVFTGDTIFIGGCGKFFEGNAGQMVQAFEKLASLPPDTKIYCGHEYTVANLTWSSQVDRNNQAIVEKLQWAREQVQQRRPTVPSTIAEELEINVFARAAMLTDVLNVRSTEEAMEKLRNMKNSGATLQVIVYQ